MEEKEESLSGSILEDKPEANMVEQGVILKGETQVKKVDTRELNEALTNFSKETFEGVESRQI